MASLNFLLVFSNRTDRRRHTHHNRKSSMILDEMFWKTLLMVKIEKKTDISIWKISSSCFPLGFNCSLFAYGQTGSGKSYSMIGYGANRYWSSTTLNKLNLVFSEESFRLFVMNFFDKLVTTKIHRSYVFLCYWHFYHFDFSDTK